MPHGGASVAHNKSTENQHAPINDVTRQSETIQDDTTSIFLAGKLKRLDIVRLSQHDTPRHSTKKGSTKKYY